MSEENKLLAAAKDKNVGRYKEEFEKLIRNRIKTGIESTKEAISASFSIRKK